MASRSGAFVFWAIVRVAVFSAQDIYRPDLFDEVMTYAMPLLFHSIAVMFGATSVMVRRSGHCRHARRSSFVCCSDASLPGRHAVERRWFGHHGCRHSSLPPHPAGPHQARPHLHCQQKKCQSLCERCITRSYFPHLCLVLDICSSFFSPPLFSSLYICCLR